MPFWELFAIAVHQLWSNKVRTLLTTLGILIGVGSVVGVVSIGQGLRDTVMGILAFATESMCQCDRDPSTPLRVTHPEP